MAKKVLTTKELAAIEKTAKITIDLPEIAEMDLTAPTVAELYDAIGTVLEKLSQYKTQLDEVITSFLKTRLIEGSDSIQANGFEFKLEKRAYKKALKPLEELHDEVFVKEEKKLVIDTKAITDYVKKNGKLPDGFVETVSTYPRLNRIVS